MARQPALSGPWHALCLSSGETCEIPHNERGGVQLALDRDGGRISRCLRFANLRVSLFPKLSSGLKRIDIDLFPPTNFVAGLMQLTMMSAAKRDSEFIANFHAQCAWLRKTQMMGIAGLTPANNARLGGDKAQMRFVAASLRFR